MGGKFASETAETVTDCSHHIAQFCLVVSVDCAVVVALLGRMSFVVRALGRSVMRCAQGAYRLSFSCNRLTRRTSHTAAHRCNCFHTLRAVTQAFRPQLVNSALLPAVVPQCSWQDIGAVRFDSTKRKRAKKMNKHKYQKMKKRVRNLNAKNVVGK
jgi:hypothetical protein